MSDVVVLVEAVAELDAVAVGCEVIQAHPCFAGESVASCEADDSTDVLVS